MITYIYETVPTQPGVEPERFEIRQSIREPALDRHPVSGESVRRVVSGGLGYVRTGGGANNGSCCAGSCGSCD